MDARHRLVAWTFKVVMVAFMFVATVPVGCSRVRSVDGGTTGTLRHGEISLHDVQIGVFAVGSSEPLGFGLSDSSGRFELYQPRALGPLFLQPGEYCFTLESMSPEPLYFPPAFRDPQSTPLRTSWSGESSTLDLQIPVTR